MTQWLRLKQDMWPPNDNAHLRLRDFLGCNVIGFCTVVQPFSLHASDVALSL